VRRYFGVNRLSVDTRRAVLKFATFGPYSNSRLILYQGSVSVLKILAKPVRAPNKALGVGTYYERGRHGLSGFKDWTVVKLERPLIIDQPEVRILEQEYATDAEDAVVAMSGAWKLRRDMIRLGYDSLVVVRGDCVKIVQYCRSIIRDERATTRALRCSVREHALSSHPSNNLHGRSPRKSRGQPKRSSLAGGRRLPVNLARSRIRTARAC
jgi:hypothetical protein